MGVARVWRPVCWARLGAPALLAVGLGWAMAGCGTGDIVRPVANSGMGLSSGLVLADSMTRRYFSLSVVDGAPTLTEVGTSGPTPTEQELVDGASGTHFSLAVTNGALTLIPGSSAATAETQIGLIDRVTAKRYELAVVSGGLTLTPG
jgi:hypothetical protein